MRVYEPRPARADATMRSEDTDPMTTTSDRAPDDEPGHVLANAPGDHHATDDHGDDGGHGDHANGDDPALGPIDQRAWAAGVAGVALGLVVVVAFVMATAATV